MEKKNEIHVAFWFIYEITSPCYNSIRTNFFLEPVQKLKLRKRNKMEEEKIIRKSFKNYKKTPQARRKRLIRILAIIGSLLMISGLIGSLIYYL